MTDIRTTERAKFWKTVPKRSVFLFFIAVFNLFAVLGYITDIARLGQQPIATMLIAAVISGTFAVGYAYCAIRNRWLILAILPFQFLTYALFPRYALFMKFKTTGMLDATRLRDRLMVDVWLIYFCVMFGYILFIRFIRHEGRRYFRSYAEIELAKEIHQHLVPPIAERIGEYEFQGVSLPSGEVGGDLVDLVQKDGRWAAILADVSGHGVPAGVFMAMFKTAVRMTPALDRPAPEFLAGLNHVLSDLSKPNMYATVAAVRLNGEGTLDICLAGHLPILHWKAAQAKIEEVSIQNFPVGMLDMAEFETKPLAIAPGDLLVFLTDGLSETADKKGEEFGMDRVKKLVAETARGPLSQISDALFAAVQKFGPQDDDRSLPLVRRGHPTN